MNRGTILSATVLAVLAIGAATVIYLAYSTYTENLAIASTVNRSRAEVAQIRLASQEKVKTLTISTTDMIIEHIAQLRQLDSHKAAGNPNISTQRKQIISSIETDVQSLKEIVRILPRRELPISSVETEASFLFHVSIDGDLNDTAVQEKLLLHIAKLRVAVKSKTEELEFKALEKLAEAESDLSANKILSRDALDEERKKLDEVRRKLGR